MRALITNDDGIDSPGLAVLASAALEAGLVLLQQLTRSPTTK